MPIVDWLNFISSTSDNIEDVLTVEASPNPLPVKISPDCASTNFTWRPNLVVWVALALPVIFTTSSSDILKSYTSMYTKYLANFILPRPSILFSVNPLSEA